MGNIKVFNFSTNFNEDGNESLRVHVFPTPNNFANQSLDAANSSPTELSVDVESQLIVVELYDKQTQMDVSKYHLTLSSGDESDYRIAKLKYRWVIIHKTWVFPNGPALLELLPKGLNKLPIRVLLLLIELAWKGLKFLGELVWRVVRFIGETIEWAIGYIINGCAPGSVNITVGGPEA